MKVTLERNVDADSPIYTTPDGETERGRSKNIGAFESTTTTGKQSAKGIDQAKRQNTYVRPGEELTVDNNPEQGVFGRRLVSPTMQANGKTVDINNMTALLGDAAYFTKYGVSETDHDVLKTTYNEYLPYQFSDEVPPLTDEEFVYYEETLPKIQAMINNMKEGENLEQSVFLDQMLGDVFGDGGDEKVAAYLEIKKRKERKVDRENEPLSADKIMYDAFKDPRMQEQWDLAVMERQALGADVRLAYKGKKTFLEEAGAAMQLFNDASNLIDRAKLWSAQYVHLGATDEMIAGGLAELPEEFHGAITEEAKNHGNEAALIKMQQLKVDIRDNAVWDDMNFAKQFVYGAGAIMMSPTSAVVGGKGFQMAAQGTKAIRAWEATKLTKMGATVGTWTAAAGADSIAVNSPRVIGDHTYTTRDLALDVAVETMLGTTLVGAFAGGAKAIKPIVADLALKRIAAKSKGLDELHGEIKDSQYKDSTPDSVSQQIKRGADESANTREAETMVFEKDYIDSLGGKEAPIEKTEVYDMPIGGRPVVKSAVVTDPIPMGEMDVETTVQFSLVDEGLVEFKLVGEEAKAFDIVANVYKGSTKARSSEIGHIRDGYEQWSKKDFMAAKRAGLRLENKDQWNKQQIRNFDEVYNKLPEGDISPAEVEMIQAQQRAEDVVDGGWVNSGLEATLRQAKKGFSKLGKIGQSIGNLTGKAMSHAMQESDNAAIRFVGFNFLEDPTGFAGNYKRHTTATLRATNEKNIAMSQIMPQYADNIDKWAKAKGANFYEKFKATWGTPDSNKLAKQFEIEFIDTINARKMGRKVDVDNHMSKMLDDWQKYTDYSGNRALQARLPGWDKLRKNYFPQIRDNQKMANVIAKEENGFKDLVSMFELGMKNTREIGLHDLDDESIKDLAMQMVKQAETGQKELPDSVSSKLGRAQSRVEMDWSAEYNGKVLRDYLQTDIPLTADKYSSDLSGRIAMNKVTGGKITTDADLKGLKDVAIAKHAQKINDLRVAGKDKEALKLDKKFNKELQMLDDTFNMVLGRPPRGGLAPELRHLKQFVMLTRMGILGTSQSIETGSMIARNTMDLFNDPTVLKHMLGMKPDTPEGKALLQDIMNITGRTRDMEYLHRPQQVLDEESMKSYDGLRQVSIMLADKATGGGLKQPASRLLGKHSMFNWVQKNQSEYVQKSFLIHTDRYFTTGKSSINPKRMVDLGLINTDGTNTELSHVFNNVIKKNEHGHIVDLQWDKWSQKAKEQYMDAAQRDEAQRLQQTFAGEAPAYYNKPLMNLLFQFREVPLVAQNKQLARSLAFGDVEAASSVMLNLAIAGMVRYGWVGGLGYAKAVAEGETDNYQLPGLDRLDVMRYMAAGGLIPDTVSIANSGFQVYNNKDLNSVDRLASQLPVYGLLKDYGTVGTGLATGDLPKVAESLQGLTMLGNVGYMDVIHTMFVKNIEEMETYKGED